MSFLDTALRFWGERSARERAALTAGGVLVALAALYAFLWEPGLAARHRLAGALPVMRAQLLDMREQQREILALRKTLAPAARPADVRSLLQASLAKAEMGAAFERIDSISPERAVAFAPRVPFDAWLAWSAGLQRDFGIRLDACSVAPLEQPGLVRVEATFVSAGNAP